MRPFTDGKFRATDSAGAPISGAKLYTYQAGSAVNQATYTTAALSVQNTNPVQTNANGYADVWLHPERSYRMVLKSADEGTTYWDVDGITDGYAIDTLTYTPGWTGSVSSSVGDVLKREIWVEDFGAVGDDTTDSAAAIQAAIDYAESLIGTNAYNDVSVCIRFGRGRFRVGTTLTVTRGGISFVGVRGRGTVIKLNTGCLTLFDVGDRVNNSFRTRANHFENLVLFASDTAAQNTCFSLYRTTWFKLTDVFTCNFWLHVDAERMTIGFFERCEHVNTNRTAQAKAIYRFRGTDESVTGSNAYSPGGDLHFTDIDIAGASGSGSYDTDSGFEVMSVDGMYLTQCHFTGCVKTLNLCPDASAANRTIIDVMASNCYFDEPSSLSSSDCVSIGGTVKESITLASGATASSTYQAIRFVQCLFRGNNEALRGVIVEVTDGDSWFDSTKELSDLVWNGCTFRGFRNCGLQVRGALTSPANTWIEPTGVRIIGNHFQGNNDGGATGSASDIIAQCESVVIANNVFLAAATDAADYVVWCVVGDAGDDDTQPSVVLTGNDFSKATEYAVRVFDVSRSSVNVSVEIADNLMPGAGRALDQSEKLRTTNATPTTLWSYPIPENTAGALEVVLAGSNSSATRHLAYSWTVGFKRETGGPAVLSGPTAGLAYKDTTTPAPTLALSGNSLTLEVTGVAATEIDWHARIKGVLAR